MWEFKVTVYTVYLNNYEQEVKTKLRSYLCRILYNSSQSVTKCTSSKRDFLIKAVYCFRATANIVDEFN